METTHRWSPIHGYLLVTLLGVALASPVLLAPRSASARGEPQATAAAPALKPERRTLSVQGTAEVLTTPDEVMIQFRIDSFDRSLKASKRDNDAKARNALATLEKGGVKAGAMQTSDFTITPRYEHASGQRVFQGYDVVKRVTVTHCNVEQADALLTELFENGANVLEGVHFSPSKLQEKRAEAKRLAVQGARRKAEAMAAELGQRLGPPITVQEASEGPWHGEYQRQVNAAYDNESAPASGPTLAAGKMKVQSTVSVVFELLDG